MVMVVRCEIAVLINKLFTCVCTTKTGLDEARLLHIERTPSPLAEGGKVAVVEREVRAWVGDLFKSA